MAQENKGLTISELLRKISSNEQQKISNQLKKETSVTMQQAMILRLIAMRPGLIQKDIVSVTKRRAATISTFLKNLEKGGFIVRKIPSENSRNKEIYLTNKGRDVVKKFRNTRVIFNAQLISSLSNDQQDELIRLLGIINANLEIANQ
ncbi:MarR family winged helix-turn-helix transcriptional regulator [Loigolactobacillus zhaoyuanensis]|uniref:MarR family winged helix-turn-helix transcriptional regulator n=1 Tax=Loigolactobacillus zhaoyuanensis TaxID=2486017 RepID=A0ABW8U8S5_9LACO|nr:MarR family transcriptional regulator [Loigolactobacillus zhaoyuanensis]